MDSEATQNTGMAMAMDTGGRTINSQNFFSSNTAATPTNAMASSKPRVTKTNKKRALWKMRKAKRASKQQQERRRHIRRLWQLPESSIVEYTKWIQDKPEEDRTPSEERFLWRCMIRSLGVVKNNNSDGGRKGRLERIREFVDRLEQKETMELTENEQHFVRLYHKRRKDRKTLRLLKKQEKEQTVSWMRNEGNTTSNTAGFQQQASFNLDGLRESMNRMGLSSQKLKHVRFADP